MGLCLLALRVGRKPLASGHNRTNTDAVSLDAQSQTREATPLAGPSALPHSADLVCVVHVLFPKLGWSLEQQIFNQSKFPLLINIARLFNSSSLPKIIHYLRLND